MKESETKSAKVERVELFKALEPVQLDRTVHRLFTESGGPSLLSSSYPSNPGYD